LSARGAGQGGESDLRSRLLRRVLEPVKAYAERKAVEGVLEWLLGFVKPEDVVYAVEHGEDLASMLMRCMLSNFKGLSEILSEETLFDFLRKTRPDLASVIVSMPSGAEWMKMSVERLNQLSGG
jgi:hypothetical protein